MASPVEAWAQVVHELSEVLVQGVSQDRHDDGEARCTRFPGNFALTVRATRRASSTLGMLVSNQRMSA